MTEPCNLIATMLAQIICDPSSMTKLNSHKNIMRLAVRSARDAFGAPKNHGSQSRKRPSLSNTYLEALAIQCRRRSDAQQRSALSAASNMNLKRNEGTSELQVAQHFLVNFLTRFVKCILLSSVQ